MTLSHVSEILSSHALSTTPRSYGSLRLAVQRRSKRTEIQGLKSSHTLSSGTALRRPSYRMGSSSVRGETATYCRYSDKAIEIVEILGLMKQFGNRPDVIRNPRFHSGRDSETRMHAAEIVVGKMQSARGF
jgi:hypothetical protein